MSDCWTGFTVCDFWHFTVICSFSDWTVGVMASGNGGVPTEAEMILASVQQAAQAAADAAVALREASQNRSGGFAEANKTVQVPKEFGTTTSSEDQNNWADFAFSFKQWLCFADSGYSSDLNDVEEHTEVPVTFSETPEGVAIKNRSFKLYAILAGILKNRPLRLLRQTPNSNGLEVWRQLHSLYAPKTKVRSMAILSAIMGYPAFTKDRTLVEQLQTLERLGDEYYKTAGVNIAEDILLTTLVRSLPRQVQQHIQLGMDDNTTYQQVRDRVVAYERVSSSWTKDKILVECGATPLGAVTSYASASDGSPAAMEVNLLRSKGKGKKGKGSDKGKGKQKGYAGDKGKSKGKGYDSGKGKGSSKGQSKGQQKGYGGFQQQKPKIDSNTCAYGGKSGHWQRDCHKRKADQQQVRVVTDGQEPKPETAYSTSSMTIGSGSQAIRLVTAQDSFNRVSHFEDLTLHSCPTSPTSTSCGLRVVSELCEFDMSATDDDDRWTLSPTVKQHLGVVSNMDAYDGGTSVCDVILDSGADTSALPLKYGHVGIEGPAVDTCYVDAQGAPLTVQSTRLANVQFGDVTFKERFIVSDVTCPLLSLGSVLRAGWNIMHMGGTPHLVKDDMKIAVMFRNNSLRARGQISMVSQQDPRHVQPGVRALQLGVVLRCLTHGWNRINPHLFAIRTVRPQHVNTTLCPSDELMWLRTTLVFREGSGWEIDEYCEAISEIQHNLEDEILFPDTVVEVITLAHKYAMEYEQLGFFMQDPSTANPANFEVDDGTQYEPSIGPDIEPVEAPVDKEDGEPLAEDRVVPYTADEETVVVDGMTMTLGCTLKVLRAGCSALGLSTRGGKSKCLQRMVEHVKAQALLAAHGAEVHVKQDMEREPLAQSRPEEPSQQEVENHALTHEPFKSWCSLCTRYRSRQDPHPVSSHESVGHSVLSLDFGYCSRMEDESDKQTCLFMHDRATKFMHAVPTPQKGAKFLQHMVTEVTRFIVYTQHRELAIRTDREPSILSVVDGVRKACRSLGIVLHDEGAPVGEHQSNGAAESTVLQIRSRAGLLVQQIEDHVAAGRIVFGCNHPVYCWALLHASWLHNHFTVSEGLTPFERGMDRSYTGKLAMYGEEVLGFYEQV